MCLNPSSTGQYMATASRHCMVRMNGLHNPRPESEPGALEARWKVWKFVHVSGLSIGSIMTVKGEHPSTAGKCRPHASSETMRSISMWMLSPQTMSYAPRDICNRSSSSSLSLIVNAPCPARSYGRDHIDDGYSITLTLAPKLFGGRLCLKLARTSPELPCGLVTLPQMTRIFDPWRAFDAR